jgi:hypothetical protein
LIKENEKKEVIGEIKIAGETYDIYCPGCLPEKHLMCPTKEVRIFRCLTCGKHWRYSGRKEGKVLTSKAPKVKERKIG